MNVDVEFKLGLTDVTDCEMWDVTISAEGITMEMEVLYISKYDKWVVLSPEHLVGVSLPSEVSAGIVNTRAKVKNRDGIPSFVSDFAKQLDHADDIYVRYKAPESDKWDSLPLIEVPVKEAVHLIRGWLEDRRIPVSVKAFDFEAKEGEKDG